MTDRATSPPSRCAVDRAVADNGLAGVPLLAWALLLLVLVIDGFDLALLGMLAPAIAADFGLGPFEIGLLLGGQQAGVALAGIFGGAAGDRFGRRTLIVASVALFCLFTCAAAFAQSPAMFVVARIAGGIGLGAISPNIASYLVEILPLRWRGRLTAGAFVALALGAILCAVVVRAAEPALGWRGLFLVGGAAPLILIPLILMLLPESPLWLLNGKRGPAALASAMNRLVGGKRYTAATVFENRPEPEAPVEAEGLFGAVPVRDTVSLWMIILALQFVGTGMSHMGPTVLTASGLSLADSARIMVWYSSAGLVGSIVTAWLLPKFGSRALFLWLGGAILAGFAAMLFLLETGAASLMLAVPVIFAGFGVLGLSLIGFPLAAFVYPVGLRATGVGLAAGLGRLGSVVAPAVIGLWIGLRGAGHAFEVQIPAALLLIGAALLMRRHIPPLGR